MIYRDLEAPLVAQLSRGEEHPNVVLLEGARQVGKTTLIEALRPRLGREMLYLNLEEDRRAVHDLDRCADFSAFEKYLAVAHRFTADGQRLVPRGVSNSPYTSRGRPL